MGEPYPSRWIIYNRRKPAELKYLSKLGKEINRDSESSDERNWNSPNLYSAKVKPVAVWGLHDISPQSLNSDTFIQLQKNEMESSTIVGNSPVFEIICTIGAICS